MLVTVLQALRKIFDFPLLVITIQSYKIIKVCHNYLLLSGFSQRVSVRVLKAAVFCPLSKQHCKHDTNKQLCSYNYTLPTSAMYKAMY